MTKYVIDIVGTQSQMSVGRETAALRLYPGLRRLMDSNLFCEILDKIGQESPDEQ
jgi:hypothetical protein